MNIVIVGARERLESEQDQQAVENLLQDLTKMHGKRLHILSAGCDKGIGRSVREYCMSRKITFVEARMKLEGEDIPRAFFAHVFMARNTSLLEIGDEYHVFKGPNENGIIESIIDPAKRRVGEKRVLVYEMVMN